MWKCTVIFLLALLLGLYLFAKYVNNDFKNDKVLKNKIKQHVPKFMLDLYEHNANGSVFSGPDIVRSVIPKLAECIDNCDNHVLVFEIPATQNDEDFFSAQLKILTIFDNDVYIDLERFFKLSVYDDSNNEVLLEQKIHLQLKNNSWLTFNLTDSIRNLLTSKCNAYLRVLIASESYYKNKDFKFSLMPSKENNLEHDYPILILSYNSVKEKSNIIRTKRSLFDEDYEYDMNFIWEEEVQRKKKKRFKNSCSRRPLFVDFSEINYDTWIVQPTGYEAFQCLGKCFYPVAEHLSPTKHAVVQALLHSVAPSKVSRSCCVPTKLDPISILYIDNRGVLTYRYAYKDMVASECGCR